MEDDDRVVAQGAGVAPAEEAAPDTPDVVRIEFPIQVIVVGALSAADRARLVEAVLGELQDAVDDQG